MPERHRGAGPVRYCPLCDCAHRARPEGEALRFHRLNLWRKPLNTTPPKR